LSDQQRKVILETAQKMDVSQLEKSMDSDKQATAKIMQGGIEIHEMSPDFQKACAKLAEPIWINWAKKVGPDADDILKKAKALK